MIVHRRGHNFKSVGAEGYIKEVVECDKINKSINKYLTQLEVNHKDVSPLEMTSKQDLKYGVDLSNKLGAELFASIHMNSSKDKTKKGIGVEVWVYSDKDFIQATNVCKELGKFGFINRGVKINKEFYELKNTKCKAMIIEVCFVNSETDVNLYKSIGHDRIAKAIVQGLTGKTIQDTTKNGVYQVVTESYQDKDNAINYQKELLTKGINSFLQYKEV